jgi:lipid-A-disaccharide synthase
MGKRLYVIAGEASGDLHGGNLVRELLKLDPAMQVRAWGGDRMQAAGADVVKHYRELAFMGFTQVILHLRTILRNIKTCKADILAFKPDAVVLIDYPGFNLRIAEFAKANGIPVYYYISPQVWAWKAGRVKAIKRDVDRMYVILPFEKKWYAEHGMDVEFVGHPLLDALPLSAKKAVDASNENPVVALLPGSRTQEILRMLPVMLSVVKHFPDHDFKVAAAPSVPAELYAGIIGNAPRGIDSGRHVRTASTGKGSIGHQRNGHLGNRIDRHAARGLLWRRRHQCLVGQAVHQGEIHFIGQLDHGPRSSTRVDPSGHEARAIAQ